MKKCFNGFSSVMLLALALLLFTAPNAQAVIQLTLSTGPGPTTIIVSDGPAGTNGSTIADAGPFGDGAVTFIGSIGTWFLNVTTGSTVTSPNPLIDLNSVNSGIGDGVNALTMTFSATDYSGPEVQFDSHIGGTLGGGHSLTYQAWVNASNALNGMTTPIGALQSFGPGPGPFAGSTIGGSAPAGLYSLTQQVVLSATTVGTSSFDAAITPVPEPTSVALLGGVMLLVGSAIRRKAKSV